MSIRRLQAVLACLLCGGTAAAQFTITNVANAGSRIALASESGGIPQGAVFIASGIGIGVPFQQATFPLPTTDGLGGVSIQIATGGAVIDAIMVYVAPNEVAAILPSATPLGPATITVNNNGVSASKDIKVIAAAFGIFVEVGTGGAGTAVAFNANGDGTFAQNSTAQSVMPEQDILINGTGLGAISSDETQSGVTDVPAAAPQVWVGTAPATLVSAGRGYCCDGLDPSFRIPAGIAAWDVIRFTIPDGVTGCFIPVVVQIGNYVSNLATISIDPGGAACALPPSTLPPDLVQKLANQTGYAGGNVTLSRVIGISATQAGVVRTVTRDTGNASFFKYANVPASIFAAEVQYSTHVCTIDQFPAANGGLTQDGKQIPIVPLMAVSLDAGPAITVKGPAGTRTINRQIFGALVGYDAAADFGNGTAGNYYDPGHYTVTGTSGKDVGQINASQDVPATPFVVTKMPAVTTPIDRHQDLTITWTGAIPNTQVVVVGGSGTGSFLCAAAGGDGTLTIPSYVLLNLPASGSAVPGMLVILNRVVSVFPVQGLDLFSVVWAKSYSLGVKYQ